MTDTLKSLRAEWEQLKHVRYPAIHQSTHQFVERLFAALEAERALLLAMAEDRKRLGEEGTQLRKSLEAAERERVKIRRDWLDEAKIGDEFEAQVAKLREALKYHTYGHIVSCECYDCQLLKETE